MQGLPQRKRKHENSVWGFNSGISFVYKIKPRIEVETGIQYSQQINQLKDVPFVKYDDIIIMNPMGNDMGICDINYLYSYLEIPIKMNYRILNKNLRIYGTGGVSINIFLNERIRSNLKYYDGLEEENFTKGNSDNRNNRNNTIIALILGIGFDYDISECCNLRFEPLFRRSLQPIFNTTLKQFNYSIGGQLGFLIKI